MAEGHLHDLHSGEYVGDVPDAVEAFLLAVRAAADREPVYVVVGSGPPDDFVGRVSAVCHVVEDPQLVDGALIVAGDPSEWEPLEEQTDADAVLDADEPA